ncbi:MAG: sugar ABC transporter ATP-binding protein [Ruminococcus sp.]|jgi:inositol transport system ATP-binding protein|nr:sugar ABC transporter ATP-binding protein [Ruminococcus sp.]
MSEYILKMENICKSFSGVPALKNVRLNVKKGTLHALAGENGAGKSTLMKILVGAYKADSGTIYFNGETYAASEGSIQLSRQKGISMIFQELNLISDMTVAENIFVGREPCKNRLHIVQRKKMIQMTEELLEQFHIHNIKATDKLQKMTVAKRQMVEICKALSQDARLIIMDEPTSSITEKECENLFEIIRGLKARGITFIFISHKMDEIYKVADGLTIFRDGEFIDEGDVKQIPMNELISKMVGREITTFYPEKGCEIGETVMEVKGLSLKGTFSDITFQVRRGEILGFAGLIGAGRTEVMEAVFGYRKADAGEIYLKNEQVRINSPKDAIDKGIAFVTEDRKATGGFLSLSISMNMVMAGLKQYMKGVVVSSKMITQTCMEQKEKFDIKMSSLNQPICTLSGGNQQKVLLSKWILLDPDVIILDEPTRGIDIGAKTEIYKIMCGLAQAGKAIIMISSELPEVIGMSDNIVVMSEGKITGYLCKDEATQNNIMMHATKTD